MEELEPWNMFTNDFIPDNADAGGGDDGGDGDRAEEENNDDGDGPQNKDEEQFAIPSPVQDMQVKEEPQEPMEEAYDDDNSFGGFHSILHGDRDPNEEDEALFDFNSENSNSGRGGRSAQAETPLSAEDEYYNSLVKYEDAIVYICPACGAEYRSQENWKIHLNSMHQYNTRRGLNFIQLDKLYHECMECHKRIAMHSMENLLKHKFTHLPYRCCKCFICKRQYKYRQDLMIHLKVNHRDDLINLAKEEEKSKKLLESQNQTIRSILNKPPSKNMNTSRPTIAIGQVKENAVDIFENNTDNIEVRNEVLIDDDDDDADNSLPGLPPPKRIARDLPAFLDDASTNGSANEQRGSSRTTKLLDDIDESLEEYILFSCPQCGSESETTGQWRQHIESAHDFGSRKGLKMRDINQGQAQCLECNQTITVNTIRNLQMHKFEHLPHKKWMTCKLCFTSFNVAKDILKHLGDKHHLKAEKKTNDNNDEDSQEPFGFGADDYDDGAGAADTKKLLAGFDGSMTKQEERDAFEQHIDYLCPQCGKEFNDKKLWRKHMVEAHQLGDLETLNFEQINDRQLRCRECDKIITNAYGIQNAQQHRITHMQYKSFAKCRMCRKQYTDRKGLTKHLRNAHGVGATSKPSRITSPIPNFGSPFMMKTYKAKPYKTAAYPQREIVRHNNYTYEICYLEEEEDNNDNDNFASRRGGGGGSGVTSSAPPAYDFAKGDAHLYRRSYPAPKSSNLEQMSRHRCVDCGSSFSSHQSLQLHIKTEHEFVDFSATTRNSPKKVNANNAEEQSNDVDDLLVPSSKRDVDVVQPDEAATVECHFIYICPQCGVEFRLRHLWRRHINMEHNFDKRESLDFRIIDKFRFQCKTCHEMVQSSKLKGLQDHKFRHCPYRQYLKCLICGQAYNHKPNMISHLRQRHNIIDPEPGQHAPIAMDRNHSNNSTKTTGGSGGGGGGESGSTKSGGVGGGGGAKSSDASAANANASRPPGLKTVEDVISFHNAVDHESITYHCPSCAETFDSHVFWRKHIVDEHNLNSREGLNFRQLDDHHYICLQCYKRVTVTHTKGAIGQLQSHKFRHLPYKSFHCTACKGEFVRKQMFFKHLDKITNKCSGLSADGAKGAAEGNDSTQFGEDFGAGADNTMTETQQDSPASSAKYIWPTRASLPAQPTLLESVADNQGCFTLSCPQCGIEFETTRGWREHINIEHNLNSRSVLNFRKINSKLHLCLECNEHVNGRKLRDLQVHKFKHLPFGAYLHCRFCSMNYFHISNMQEHLKNKHPQMLQKMKPENYDDETGNLDVEDEDDGGGGGNTKTEEDDAGDDGAEEEEGGDSPPCLEDIVDIDLLEAEAEIEEVDPDNVENDDQYLLG